MCFLYNLHLLKKFRVKLKAINQNTIIISIISNSIFLSTLAHSEDSNQN